MDNTGVAELRSALRAALDAAKADGLPPEVRIALVVSELGRLMAGATSDNNMETFVGNVQAAIAYAAETASDDARYRDAVERFVDCWLN